MEQIDKKINYPQGADLTSENLPSFNSFDDLDLRDLLRRGIYSYGYERPSAIQSKGIYPIIQNRDVIGQAQSGMGKTATYSIGLLQVIDPNLKDTQAIVLANTRELADQVESVIKHLGQYLKINVCLAISGNPIDKNMEALRKRPHVVVGTPGRVYDMIRKGALRTRSVKIIVIDEADEMLKKRYTPRHDNRNDNRNDQGDKKMDFLQQIEHIFRSLPNDVQAALFSATMPDDFFEITKKLMRNPIKILVEPEKLSLSGIKQYYVNIDRNEHKFDMLCDLYNVLTITQAIIYCNSRKMVEDLSQRLIDANFSISSIHGSMTPFEREERMRQFKTGGTRVLVSTDLLSRGIDVQQISIVINYDIPRSVDNYLHRIGRSGRYGRKGVAINFKTPYDDYKMNDIEKHYNIQIDEWPSDPEEISEFL
jgi:translation initiation factor 4A